MAMVSEPGRAAGQMCSPELSATQFEEMLAELDEICRQARDLSAHLTQQMAQRKEREQQVVGTRRFPRAI
jgi:hypothetical protein